MSVEEKKEDSQNWSGGYFDFMVSPLKILASSWSLWVFFAWIVLSTAVLAIALMFVWPSITWWLDSYNDVEKTRIEKTFELQLRQLDLTENQIIPRLDDILKRLENVENRVVNLESRVTDHDRRLEQLEKKVR